MTREVTEYGLQVPATVLGKRRKLTPEQFAELDQIEYQLALDPEKHGDRLVPLPDGGGTFMYEHPDPRLQITFKLDRARKVLRILNEAAPCFQPRNFIFLSYSHVDETLFLEFKRYLSTLAERGLVQFWSDKNIEPGVAWKDEILEALASCRAALLLVSQDFLRQRNKTPCAECGARIAARGSSHPGSVHLAEHDRSRDRRLDAQWTLRRAWRGDGIPCPHQGIGSLVGHCELQRVETG